MQDTATAEITIYPTTVNEVDNQKSVVKITDVMGREVKSTKNTPLFYLFDDGTVEKRIIVD
jgi:hypothetical protein